jgi:hypothetical protein
VAGVDIFSAWVAYPTQLGRSQLLRVHGWTIRVIGIGALLPDSSSAEDTTRPFVRCVNQTKPGRVVGTLRSPGKKTSENRVRRYLSPYIFK